MAKTELSVKTNDGTKYRINFNRKTGNYVLSYRNDSIPILSVDGGKVKGKWLYLESQIYYSDILDFLFEEIRAINSIEGN